jgi:stringent starvation protein B
MINALESSSTRPYLIRALYEWCTDNGFTPYVAVQVDDSVQVPREYVKNGEIVLNISFDATSSLKLGNDFIEFKARFAGTAREISVPVGRVIAIYARENGQGMAFPAPTPTEPVPVPAPPALPAPVPAGRTPAREARAADSDAGKVVHLVPDDGVGSASGHTDVDEPPRPPSGGGARPSLKRIK